MNKTPEQWDDGWIKRKLAFKKATNVTNNIGAISVWLRQGEIEADQYASEMLVPLASLNPWLTENNKLNKESVSTFSKTLGIALGILVGRLQYMKCIPYSVFNDLKIRYNWN